MSSHLFFLLFFFFPLETFTLGCAVFNAGLDLVRLLSVGLSLLVVSLGLLIEFMPWADAGLVREGRELRLSIRLGWEKERMAGELRGLWDATFPIIGSRTSLLMLVME